MKRKTAIRSNPDPKTGKSELFVALAIAILALNFVASNFATENRAKTAQLIKNQLTTVTQ